MHARLVVLAECKGVEGDLRDVGGYGRSKEVWVEPREMVLRHKKRNADGCDDAQLREYAASMDARRLHENHKAGEGKAQAHRAELLPFVGEGDAEHQQYHAHRQDGRGGKQREDISGDKIRHFALVSGLTYFNSYAPT